MNERIRELAEQAGLKVNADGEIGPAFFGSIDAGYKKFAELIIRECLDQCYNRGMNDELYAGQLKAAAYIEEHFGVES